MLILGGAAVINALSGVDLSAAAFLIPMGVTLYTAQGGLKATFIASWAHVTIIYIALCIFMFKIYTTDPTLGSPTKVWNNLNIMNGIIPVDGNHPLGTMLTMKSHNGCAPGAAPAPTRVRSRAASALYSLSPPPSLLFGIINIIGNFGTVFVDQAYWQGAIAAKPSATYKGYLLGGMCWFAIPFTLATTLGLAGRAYDLPLTFAEAGAGLVPPAVASHTMGVGGAFLIVLQLFMAVTASGSAEQIAVSSIFAYDIFKRYMKPHATGADIIHMARLGVFGYGAISGMLAVSLQQLGLNLGWVYNAMGIFIGSAVLPLSLSITWSKCSGNAAVAGAILAQIAGIIAWVVQGWKETNKTPLCGGCTKGKVTYEALGTLNAQLAGNCAALFGSIFITIPWSLLYPQNFDWKVLRKLTDGNMVDAFETADSALLDDEGPDSREAMDKALNWTYATGSALTLILIILWPCLAIPAGHFSQSYWGWWVALAIIWGLVATISTICLPLWEARAVFIAILSSLVHGKIPEGHEASTHHAKERGHGISGHDPSVSVRQRNPMAAEDPAPVAASVSA